MNIDAHIEVLQYEIDLLMDHIDAHPDMPDFSKAVNVAVAQYMADRIKIIRSEG